MTLHRIHAHIHFECDGCQADLDTDEIDFTDARQQLSDQGWITRKVSEQWCHYCPECGEGFR